MKLTHVTVPTFLTYALSLAKLRVTQMDKSVITEALETGKGGGWGRGGKESQGMIFSFFFFFFRPKIRTNN